MARANTYQALDGLVRRGAARRAATIPARYAALAPDMVVDGLQRGFLKDLGALQESLRALPVGRGAESGRLVIHDDWRAFESGAAKAVDQASEEVLAVAGPWAPAVMDALVRARGRGAAVKALALGRPAPQGLAVRDVPEHDLLAYWSGRPLAVVLDRSTAWCGIQPEHGGGGGIETAHAALVPFLRHLLRRELATA